MSDPTQYREITPPPSLAPFIRCLWHLTGPADTARQPQPIVPDGCVEIVLNCADPFVRVNGGMRRQPAAMLVGQLTGPVVVVPTGAVDVWGVRLHPWSAAVCLAISLADLRETTVGLDDVLGARLTNQLHDASRDGSAGMLLSTLEGWLRPRAHPDVGVRAAVEVITRDGMLPSVRAMSAQLGRSTRWVQRSFRDAVGLTPKMLLRIKRVQRAMRLASNHPTRPWSAIAADVGYFDQSHLVRDFRDIVGVTPSAFSARERPITDAFIESR